MAFNGKICPISDLGQLFRWQAEIHLYNFMALRTCQVVVMVVGVTDAVMMGTVGKLDAIQQPDIDKLLH
jgi:hypothetical protein